MPHLSIFIFLFAKFFIPTTTSGTPSEWMLIVLFFFSSNMNGNSVAEKRNQDFWIKHLENMIIRKGKTNLKEHMLLAHKTINSCGILTVFYGTKKLNLSTKYGTNYSRIDQVKLVDDSRPYHFKFFKGCLPQI